jgi:hypothetical protein
VILVILRHKFHLVGDGVDVDESGVVCRFEFEPELLRFFADGVDNVHAVVERQNSNMHVDIITICVEDRVRSYP